MPSELSRISVNAGFIILREQQVRPKPEFPRLNELLELLGIDAGQGNAQSRVGKMRNATWSELLQAAGKVFVPGVWCLTRDDDEISLSTTMWNRLDRGASKPCRL